MGMPDDICHPAEERSKSKQCNDTSKSGDGVSNTLSPRGDQGGLSIQRRLSFSFQEPVRIFVFEA